MPSYAFPFHPTAALPDAVLRAKSTRVTVSYQPLEIYVLGVLEPPPPAAASDDNDSLPTWRVRVDMLPDPSAPARRDDTAVLHATKGELGRLLGAIELGLARDARKLTA